MSLHSYSSIYALGHKAVMELLKGPVIVQEKVDGSQFSFGVDTDGNLQMRSKGQDVYAESAGMFDKATKTVTEMQRMLPRGITFRCEYLSKPKHNVNCYGRAPVGWLVLYDVDQGDQQYLPPHEVAVWGVRLGLEVVPTYHVGEVSGLEQLQGFLDRESMLGGPIEGVAIKPLNYDAFGRDKKVLMAKLVRDDFKEVHKKTWKQEHGQKTSSDIIAILVSQYATEARWAKAVQHLTESGRLSGEPKDIGLLMKEVPDDVFKERGDDIKDQLFKWAAPQLRRLVTRGMPEWYKARIAESQVFAGAQTDAVLAGHA